MKWCKEFEGARLPVKSWCAQVEEGALQQARNLANHPVTRFHVALMPDCHVGYGMPIGGVIAARNALIPNAVGVDIGCGMVALECDVAATEFADMRLRQDFMRRVKQWVPLGEGRRHGSEQRWEGFERFRDEHPAAAKLWPNKLDRQNLGSLGGGNHFIELQSATDGALWVMVHSGSRNLGQRVANHYHDLARTENNREKITLPDQDLAFLPADSRNGKAYFRDMNFALSYALENRRRMTSLCKDILTEMVRDIGFRREINIHHNYAAIESHFGSEVYLHRKGATRALKGEIGIIPGSMGTASYIVRGLGNPDSFMSCSHGAGRIMSRREANRVLSEDSCNAAMKGIAFDEWGKARTRWGGKKEKRGTTDLSEAPQAYKDIDEVMAAQSDLVEIQVGLQPLAVIKG